MAMTARQMLESERDRITKCIESYGVFLAGKTTEAQRINFTNMYANNLTLLDETKAKLRGLDTREKKWS
ncbi:MAG: hypothetical protein ACRDC4_08025 [Plesiomonas sp.]